MIAEVKVKCGAFIAGSNIAREEGSVGSTIVTPRRKF